MPPFLPLSVLLPAPPPLPPPPPPPRAARRHAAPLAARRHAAPLAAASKPTPRRPYRRRPAPAPEPPPRPRNAVPRASFRARSEDELEEAIYDFMRRSDKPGAFPTRAELLAAGRADLAAAVESSGGWISLGWSSGSDTGAAVTAPASSGGGVHPDYPPEPASWGGGVHPNYPPEAGASDLAPTAGASGREAEASPSGRQPETEETAEAGFRTGLEGMLTRLQRERERARPPPRSSNQAGGQCDNALMSHSGAPSHIATVGRYTPMVPENENIHSSHSQNGLEDNKALRSSTNDAWRTWSLDKGGFSDFQAAEVHPSDRSKLFEHDDIALVQDVAHRPSDGVAVDDHPSDGVDSERDEIHSRLHNLELDLTAALKTLRSRFDRVLSDMSNGDGADVLNGLSDSWEFEETKVMQAQEELRSIRAKIAILEGKMALEIIERNKIIEVKQRRLDEVEKALSELRTVYIVWPNPASEVLLTGSFDGWTSQRRMARSERGIFSLSLRLYPGRYEIKFIVDGVWRNDPLRPTVTNHGHENNLLIVT